MEQRKDPETEPVRVIKALGETPRIGPIPADLLFPWVVILVVCFFITQALLGLSLTYWAAISAWFCATWWILTGSKSWLFTDKFVPLPGNNYYNNHSVFIPATDDLFQRKMTTKIKKLKIKTAQGKTENFAPFQIESDLHAIMQIELEEEKFAVILMCDSSLQWSATIPFALSGIHPELYPAEISNQAEAISEAFKSIPENESLTFMLGGRSKYRRRLEQLKSQVRQCDLPLIELILESDCNRTREISDKGFRQQWQQFTFCHWSQAKQDVRETDDLLGKAINWFKQKLGKKARQLLNTEDIYWRNIYVNLARDIYENAYLPWKLNLGTKAGLVIRNVQAEEIWSEILWYRFNPSTTVAPAIPQLIKVRGKLERADYSVETNYSSSYPPETLSILLAGNNGLDATPSHNRNRDRLEVNGEQVAVMTLENMTLDKYDLQWSSVREQLKWIWTKLKDIQDVEVWVEISSGNKELAHDNLYKLSRQSGFQNEDAAEDGAGIDVGATLKQEESIEAQKRLHQGAEPLFAAVTILIYRKNPKELDRACTYLTNAFVPAKITREKNIAWKLWTETLPFNNQRQLKSTEVFTERRPTFDTTTIAGVLPFTKPKDIDRRGMELIYAEGGYPLNIDLYTHSKRAIITGKSGSGKSVLAFGLIKDALARGVAVVGMDMSNAGESTFETVTELLKDAGAYINITERSFNILQPPDVRRFSPEKRQQRLRIWKNFTRQVLLALVMGQIDDEELRERVDSIILMLFDIFLQDPTIIERYNLAFDGGWQSESWQKMPTLKDLIFYCSRERLGLHEFGDIESRAINQIVNQIKAKIADPNIGSAISQPSDIPLSPRMMFFALSGLTNENNAYVMSLVTQAACLNIALEKPKSLFVIDECSVLFGKRGFADIVGERFATGRKEGQSVLVIGQDIEAIRYCGKASTKIFRNTDIYLTGKTTSDAAKSYQEILNFPDRVIKKNAGESFSANRQDFFSNWLVSQDDRFWHCRYFPSLVELAALANGTNEKAARNRILALYPNTFSGKIRGLAHFAHLYHKTLVSGLSLSSIGVKNHDSKIAA